MIAGNARVERYLLWALIVGLTWVPFWQGSNREWTWGVNVIYFGLLVLIYEVRCLVTQRSHAVTLRRIWFPAVAASGVVLLCLIQISPWTPAQWRHPIWGRASGILGRDLAGAISVSPDETILALLRFLTVCAVFWLSLQLSRSRVRAGTVVRAIAIIGCVYAIYGVGSFFLFPEAFLWDKKVFYSDSVTSTFVNRNSYATYAALGLAAAASAVADHYAIHGDPIRSNWLRRLLSLVSLTIGKGGLWIGCAFVIGSALVLTGSRGGTLSGLVGFAALIAFASFRSRTEVAGIALGVFAGSVVMGGVLLWFGETLALRIGNSGLSSDDRLAVYAATWRSILDAPLLGFGDGTFADVFPMYRDASIGDPGVFWDKAHNSYLELAQGLGLPMSFILLAGIVVLTVSCVRAIFSRRDDFIAPLAASVATIIVALHSTVDFSMQIQAVAVTWAALLGAGVAQSWSSRIDTSM